MNIKTKIMVAEVGMTLLLIALGVGIGHGLNQVSDLGAPRFGVANIRSGMLELLVDEKDFFARKELKYVRLRNIASAPRLQTRSTAHTAIVETMNANVGKILDH